MAKKREQRAVRSKTKKKSTAKDRPVATSIKPPTTFREYLGLGIQQRRLAMGLTQSRLGEMANVSLKYVGEIERAEANPTLETFQQLLGVLNWNPIAQPVELDGAKQIGAMFVGTPAVVRGQLIALAQSIPIEQPPPSTPPLPPPTTRSEARGIRATAKR